MPPRGGRPPRPGPRCQWGVPGASPGSPAPGPHAPTPQHAARWACGRPWVLQDQWGAKPWAGVARWHWGERRFGGGGIPGRYARGGPRCTACRRLTSSAPGAGCHYPGCRLVSPRWPRRVERSGPSSVLSRPPMVGGDRQGVKLWVFGERKRKLRYVYRHCSIGSKAEVSDAELHAIQKGLAFLASSGWPAGRVVICADNQAALLTLAANNPEGLEHARNALLTVSTLRNEGWSVSGLWTPAHCGILGTRERTSWPKPARNLKHPVTMRGLRNLGFRPRRTLSAGPIHGLSKGTTQAQPSCRPRSL